MMAFSANPPTQQTGAPGESTCADCHNQGTTGNVKLTVQGTSSAPATWAPGVVQHLTATVTDPGKTGFGFELSARDASNNQAGSLTAGTGSAVQTTSGVQYIFQTSKQSPGFNFDWTPPGSGSGTIKLYLVGVAGSGTSSSRNTYTASYALTSGVTQNPSLTVNPTALTFSMTSGGTTPAPQTFQVTSSGTAIAFTTTVGTTSGGNWLTATPAGGNTPQAVSVAVNPAGLTAGTYKGTVAIASTGASNSPQMVGVTFTIGATATKPNLTSTPTSLTFNASGSTAVAPQTLAIASSGAALSFTAVASTTTGGNWLTVTPSAGTTPASLSVTATAGTLAAGTYNGAVTLTSTTAGNSPLTTPVVLTVGTTTPTTGISSFNFVVLDTESGGPTEAIITGAGSARGSRASGGGRFDIFTPSGAPPFTMSMSGTWRVISVVSHAQVASNAQAASTAAVLQLNVVLVPTGAAHIPAVMTIQGTGQETGVSLSITGGASYIPSGVAEVTIGTTRGEGGRSE
jgi:hypothetical protein